MKNIKVFPKRIAMKTRVEYIDLAKGYGIVAIMAWHIHLAPFFSIHYMKFWVLPMFFLLSGVFAKTEMTFIELIKRDVKRFFVPMFFFNAIYLILNMVFFLLLPDQYSISKTVKSVGKSIWLYEWSIVVFMGFVFYGYNSLGFGLLF